MPLRFVSMQARHFIDKETTKQTFAFDHDLLTSDEQFEAEAVIPSYHICREILSINMNALEFRVLCMSF